MVRQPLLNAKIFADFHTFADSILGADGAGVVVSPLSHPLYNKPVLISPQIGWKSSTYGPDASYEYGILGGSRQTGGRGTLAEYIAVEDVVPCPAHLLEARTAWEEAAALPLAALTAYRFELFHVMISPNPLNLFFHRAVFTKAEIEKGHNVFITGIGGG